MALQNYNSTSDNTSATGKKKQLSFAIFGLGRAGSIHLGNLARNPRAVLRYIVEEDRKRAEEVLNQFGIAIDSRCILGAAESNKVYEDKSVDAVIVCTYTYTHEEIVKKAIESGKSVFCEKPIASKLSAVKSCYDAAEEHDKLLYCAFNRRYDPSIRALQQRVRSGDLGQVQCIKTCSRDGQLPPLAYFKISGGIFHDCGVHDIDVVCWILGEFPDVVYAQAHAFHKEIAELNDVDQVNITMKFSCGTIATIDLNRDSCYGYDQRIEVFGSAGMLQTYNYSDKVKVVSHLGKNGASMEPLPHSFSQRYAESYAAELDYFIHHELGLDDHIEVSRTDTIMAVIIAEACEQSYRKGIPVKIKELMSNM